MKHTLPGLVTAGKGEHEIYTPGEGIADPDDNVICAPNAPVEGSIAQYDAATAKWIQLPPGEEGQVLRSEGAGNKNVWGSGGGGIPWLVEGAKDNMLDEVRQAKTPMYANKIHRLPGVYPIYSNPSLAAQTFYGPDYYGLISWNDDDCIIYDPLREKKTRTTQHVSTPVPFEYDISLEYYIDQNTSTNPLYSSWLYLAHKFFDKGNHHNFPMPDYAERTFTKREYYCLPGQVKTVAGSDVVKGSDARFVRQDIIGPGTVSIAAGTSALTGFLHTGTAQGGGASTITLALAASVVDDFYNGMKVRITSGQGAGQIRTISDYVGATRVATVSEPWDVGGIPNATSVYSVDTGFWDELVEGDLLEIAGEYHRVKLLVVGNQTALTLYTNHVAGATDVPYTIIREAEVQVGQYYRFGDEGRYVKTIIDANTLLTEGLLKGGTYRRQDPPYQNGTVTVAPGSTTVTGTGVNFFGYYGIFPGVLIEIDGLERKVVSTNGQTVLTIDEPHPGATDVPLFVVSDTYAPAQDPDMLLVGMRLNVAPGTNTVDSAEFFIIGRKEWIKEPLPPPNRPDNYWGHQRLDGRGSFRHIAEWEEPYSDTAQGGTINTIVLSLSDWSTDDYYNYWDVTILSGTGAGQERVITDYVGATRTATVRDDWDIQPDATSVYEVRKRKTQIPGGLSTIKVRMKSTIEHMHKGNDSTYQWEYMQRLTFGYWDATAGGGAGAWVHLKSFIARGGNVWGDAASDPGTGIIPATWLYNMPELPLGRYGELPMIEFGVEHSRFGANGLDVLYRDLEWVIGLPQFGPHLPDEPE